MDRGAESADRDAGARSIAWVARGVVTNRTSSAAADGATPPGERQAWPDPVEADRLPGEPDETALGQVLRDREGQHRRHALAALGLLERRRVTLEDLLVLLGDAEPAQQRGDRADVRRRRRAEQPRLLPQLVGPAGTAGERVVRADDQTIW